MAFLAPLFASFLTEIGLTGTAAATAEAIGASAATGAAAGTAVTGAVAGAAASTVQSGLESAVDTAFGSGTAKNVEQKVSETKQDFSNIASAYLSGNYESLVKQKLKEKRERLERERLQNEQNSLAPDITSGLLPQPLPPTQQDSSVSGTQPLLGVSGNKALHQQQIKQIAEDLAEVINEHQTEIMKGRDPVNSYNDLDSYLSGPIIDFLQNKDFKDYLPNDDQFKKIWSIYDGARIIPRTVHEEPNPLKPGYKIFGAFDEAGLTQIYYQHDPTIVLRPLWPGHVWTGMNSPNNKLPVDLWDTFSFYHDVTYQPAPYGFGLFNRQGDYQYISRLAHGLADNRFPVAQRSMIKNTIMYFSTIGSTLSMFNNDPTRTKDTQFDYSSVTSATSVTSSTPNVHFVNYVDPSIDMTDAENIELFKITLEQETRAQLESNDPISVAASYQAQQELTLLQNLSISLV
jgi:hypothetical protein